MAIRTETEDHAMSEEHQKLSGANRRTLDAISRHPVAHNLEWSDVVALIEHLGTVEQKANAEFAFQVHGQRHVTRKPHTKDLAGPDVVELRKFLMRAGLFAGPEEAPAGPAAKAAPNLMVVMDHHGAKLYDFDVTAADAS